MRGLGVHRTGETCGGETWQSSTEDAMERLTPLEFVVVVVTAIWLACLLYPGYELSDWLGSFFVCSLAMVGLGLTVLWIKNNGGWFR